MEEKLKQESADIIKVVLFGPESSGKTTLSKSLAQYYNTVWVPEYARDYLQEKWDKTKQVCELSDLLPIAIGQIRLENELSKQANKILICDTDLLETKVYSESYFDGYCDPLLEKYALENSYDLFLLTHIDIPWKKDDLRDRPNRREEMFRYFADTLIKYGKNFKMVYGSQSQRMKMATRYLNTLIKKKEYSSSPIE